MPMNYLLTLSYDGTNYCGFQVQPNGRSVAQTVQDALEAVLGHRPDIKGCSRTDAGVHALGFALNFHADTRIPVEKLPLALNQHLPMDIRVLSARVVPDGFHARYAAHTKTYLYRIRNSPIDSPFDEKYYARVPRRLDAARMQQAADKFVGTHDFRALCAAGSSAAAHGDTVRTITACTVTRKGDEVDITVTAICTTWCGSWPGPSAKWGRAGWSRMPSRASSQAATAARLARPSRQRVCS